MVLASPEIAGPLRKLPGLRGTHGDERGETAERERQPDEERRQGAACRPQQPDHADDHDQGEEGLAVPLDRRDELGHHANRTGRLWPARVPDGTMPCA